MPTASKDLVTPTKAAALVGVARNTVMHRIATGRYDVERHGGVTFVVLESLAADLAAKDAAGTQAA
jgi:hypothetical protein